MANLERKKAFVAEQQRQLASMIAGKDEAPPWKRPKIANASVSSPTAKPWTHWTCTCVVRSTHPVAHAKCHRCGADQYEMEKDAIAKDKVNLRPRVKVKPNGAATFNAAYRFQTPPGPPPMPVVPVVASTNVAVHRVCTMKDTESENTMLDVDLDNAAIIINAIHGPEVTKVIGTLGERPHEISLDGDVFSAISKEKDAIAVAMQEVATVSSLSQHIKDAADERLQVLRDGLAKLELKAHGSVDCVNADLAFSTLDKARANAVAQKDAWVSRVSKRKQAVFEETMQ